MLQERTKSMSLTSFNSTYDLPSKWKSIFPIRRQWRGRNDRTVRFLIFLLPFSNAWQTESLCTTLPTVYDSPLVVPLALMAHLASRNPSFLLYHHFVKKFFLYTQITKKRSSHNAWGTVFENLFLT